MTMGFSGRPPGGGAGEMSYRTKRLRPEIGLTPKQVTQARMLRRTGFEPEVIAEKMGAPLEEVEKALVQMRCSRPETTRGTLNVTLEAHRLIASERKGNEPMWRTMDRLVGELLQLRAEKVRKRPAGDAGGQVGAPPSARRREPPPLLALLGNA